MSTLKLFAVALILSAASATTVVAQEAIQEPGLYAFNHPNDDLLHARNSAADALAAYRVDTDRVRPAVRHRTGHRHSNRAN